ncbi:MAG: shikimate kinase [Balneolales bacterium]|nr:shikimate kinase [Balneolales bacterium]
MNEYRLTKFSESIFMVGFMASGKSTIGRALSASLDMPFKDLDEVIEDKEGRSVKEIFKNEGESYFRQKEWEYLLELTRTFKGVVALGGGSLQSQQIVDHLKLHGLLVYLKTPIRTIIRRVVKNKKRPIVLDNEGKLKSEETLFEDLNALYSNRIEYYQQAQIHHDTSGFGSKEEQVNALIDKIKRYV